MTAPGDSRACWCPRGTTFRSRPRCAAGWATPTCATASARRHGTGVPSCPGGGTRPRGSRGCSPRWGRDPRVAGGPRPGGVTILALLVVRVGTGPFLEGVRLLDARSLAAAAGIGVVATVSCAWRWSLVARGLGVPLPLPGAVAACYRAQLVNATLPGGIVGDVHRAVRHGRGTGDLGRGLRAVAWERSAGQAVQLGLAFLVLLLLPSPVRGSIPAITAAVAGVALALWLLARVLSRSGPSPAARAIRALRTDLRSALFQGTAGLGILLASVLAVTAHVATFLLAARVAGSSSSPVLVLPLALLVLLAMGLPTNVAGWGPREGVAAWAFASAGLGADLGVATAVVYGVMALVASLPGAVVIAAGWLREKDRTLRDDVRRQAPQPVRVLEGTAHG
ncbi:lysylphosphatidylglycerol synthase transmembrane domain-containing protein [Nocardioides ungokensis]|uniref:lysylphosphatidylglycerol synthase transmembrane domain-containing protein n=1 Tax=Nocardioides ungokensis TaxID=1643322 RepID=UPI003CCCB96E